VTTRVTRVAAFDCGTNSLRLLVADLEDGAKTDVHREMRVVRLGQGVDRTGELAPEALERVRAALADYAVTCRDLGVQASRFVATSATRDARNRDAFTALVEQAVGVPPEVVDGDTEAALSLLGATRDLDPAQGPYLVMDIGGGSTEFVVGDGGRVLGALSVDVGCVRLTERHLHDDPPTPEQVAAARLDVEQALDRVREVVPVAQARTAVGLAGSVTTVAALALGLEAYDPARIHLSRISASQVRRVTEQLLGATWRERAALPVMHTGRADVIGAGALVLDAALTGLELDQVLVSEADILDGIAWSVPDITGDR
jgi:exopolyphosphatase/guanosine-5'-triphosphate,3'-diphosphate pyrophosphatase